MKRILSLALCLVLALGLLAGCGPASGSGDNNLPANRPVVDLTPPGSSDSSDRGEGEISSGGGTVSDVNTLVGKNGEKIRYVMIYNPKIYEERDLNSSASSLATGTFGSQIDVDVNRGEGLENLPEYLPYDQELLDPELLEKLDFSGNRGEGLSKIYKVGDTADFYAFSNGINAVRTKETFTCAYAGQYANVWYYGSVDSSLLQIYGQEFDRNVYQNCVDAFGEPRFDSKVNLLYYAFPGNTMGCFCGLDLFATGEISDREVAQYGLNLDHNILHINYFFAANSNYRTAMLGTLAHEFQHLLCFTGYFTCYNQCDSWINEGMSGYIEEKLYPGGKEQSGHFSSFNYSDLLRYGQSLYNFNTTGAAGTPDIGAYGSVYYFSEYLASLAGDDIFSKFHRYWRSFYEKGLDEAKALYDCVPSGLRAQVSASVTYPSTLRFASAEQEWMSKLALNFHVSVLSKGGSSSPAAYKTIDPSFLVYDKLDNTSIEGGGRIIVATRNGSFTIPSDADSGLVYVGFDANFNVVTDVICK